MIDKILQMVASLTAIETVTAVVVLAFLLLVARYAWKGFSRDSARSGANKAMDRFASQMSYADAAAQLKSASKNVLIKLFTLKRHFKRLDKQLQLFRKFGAGIFQWRQLEREANTKADQARALAHQAREEREWAELASAAKKKAEWALSTLPPADRQLINTAPLHAALAEARRQFSAGDFEQAYKRAHPIAQAIEYALEEARLCKRFACFSEDTVASRDRAIYTTARTHLEKARAFMKSEETFKQVRTQLTCARIKIEYLEENSPKN
jgi:hypothetical protein